MRSRSMEPAEVHSSERSAGESVWERSRLGAFESLARGVGVAAGVDGADERLLGVVLVGHRSPKHGEDAVAHELLDPDNERNLVREP